ncbi:hypothetical protein A9978_19085 [Pseudomonas sp. UMC65]|uniref:hypothetical protein n=1 Tax=Pseudomonas sp. UMC65 TaxID=1862323 RepID=UPI0016003EDC|nr:hypothetical protein [Pseudomonas sp. UMC65]MBB1614545.1 hypothetical protein [Pseudomonas sp. UMC65]
MVTLVVDTLQSTDYLVTVNISELAGIATKVSAAETQLGNLPVSAVQFGALGGGHDDTVAIQAATNASKNVTLPEGNWLVSNTIQLQPGGRLTGAGMLRTRLQRKGIWLGPTVRIGQADGSVSAGDCAVKGMVVEQLHPGFELGVSSTMVDRLLNEQAQISCYGGYACEFDDLWFQHGVYGIELYGCVVPSLSRLRSFGAWDNKIPAVCEQKAVVRLGSNAAVPGHAFCTEVRMDKLYIGTGAPSAPRTITVGSDISYTAYENLGSKWALQIEAVEGLSVTRSYLGGPAAECVAFIPASICTMIRFDDTFFDETYFANVRFYAGNNAVIGISFGPGCLFNGQSHTRHAIFADDNGGQPTVIGMTVQGMYSNMLETPFYFANAKAVVFNGPIVSAYNTKMSKTNSQVISAGAYFDAPCREIHVNGGLWGGGTNSWSTSNGCKWGPVWATSSVGTACNVRGILSSTITGGTLVGGISQTYPT